MQRLIGSTLVLTLCSALVGLVATSDPALAVGPETAELGPGGRVLGDISSTPGEEDRIGIDLLAGSSLSLKFVPKFASTFSLVDPEGDAVTLPASKKRKTTAKGLPIEKSGRYEFRIAATDGGQGSYSLSAKPEWNKSLKVEGTSGDTVEFIVPVGTQVKGTVKAVKSPGYVPRIDGLTGPTGELVPEPLDGRRSRVKLPTVTATAYGRHSLTIGASAGAGSFRAAVKLKVPKTETRTLNIRNGINSVSFTDDGVAQVFKNRCASCHSHNHASLATYGGAKRQASDSLRRMRSGNMPRGSGMPASEIALVEQWIKTGRTR